MVRLLLLVIEFGSVQCLFANSTTSVSVSSRAQPEKFVESPFKRLDVIRLPLSTGAVAAVAMPFT
jgi:hypothetical protein